MNSIPNRPIFIVGCPRSGTTLTRHILDAHQNIACGPETHFLKDLEKIFSNYWVMIQRYQFNEAYWHQKIAEFFNSFKMEYAQKCGKQRWAEKTPNYSFCLELINCLFPDCQIIHIIRDGRDVVSSHLDRWGYKSAIKATDKWNKAITSIRSFSQNLSSDRYFEVRYEELVTETEKTLKELFEYLHEPWNPAVLEKGSYENSLTKRRRQNGKDDSLFYTCQVGAGKKISIHF